MTSIRDSIKNSWLHLRNVEWQTLDIKEAGGWPWLLKALIALLVFLVALLGINWWLVSEVRDSLAVG